FVTLYYTLVHYFVIYITGNGFNVAYLKGPILIEMILNVLLYYVLFKLFKKIFKFSKFKFI
ncbi:MAG: rod shape-determining protein MreD, partial [Finegoldia magna]|nr:rod shape-determining protein MreD [Finegoldia magna]